MRGIEQVPALYDAGLALLEATGLGRWRRWLASGATGRVLDLGCGTGRNLPLFGERVRPVGLDPCLETLRAARRRVTPAPIVLGAAERLPFRPGSFDTVVSGLVFCSVEDPPKAFAEVRRVLAPGGTLRMLEHVRATSRLPRPAPGRLPAVLDAFHRRLPRRTGTRRRPSRQPGSASRRGPAGLRGRCAGSSRSPEGSEGSDRLDRDLLGRHEAGQGGRSETVAAIRRAWRYDGRPHRAPGGSGAPKGERPAMFSDFSEAKSFVEKWSVEMVDLKFCDLWGRWHHVTIPASRFDARAHGEGRRLRRLERRLQVGRAPATWSWSPTSPPAFLDPFWEVPTL